jgi:hypothetical protein
MKMLAQEIKTTFAVYGLASAFQKNVPYSLLYLEEMEQSAVEGVS